MKLLQKSANYANYSDIDGPACLNIIPFQVRAKGILEYVLRVLEP